MLEQQVMLEQEGQVAAAEVVGSHQQVQVVEAVLVGVVLEEVVRVTPPHRQLPPTQEVVEERVAEEVQVPLMMGLAEGRLVRGRHFRAKED